MVVFGQQQEAQQQQQQQQRRGRGGGGGEIVEVQGGHIVRSTGRKDRHSKVCTAKGPRDRRVRLSAHTAIQFYDVQDRLGYDRPSKAVDWLIKNAKDAIDKLAELPAWHPAASAPPDSLRHSAEHQFGDTGKRPIADNSPPFDFGDSGAGNGSGNGGGGGGGGSSTSFLPASLDSDAIADTIKSFFPMGAGASATAAASATSIGFHSYHGQSQDLRLSLQSFQDPIFPNPHSAQPPTAPSAAAAHHQALFSANLAAAFDPGSAVWSEPHQRLVPCWNVVEPSAFNMPPPPPPQPPPMHPSMVLGQNQFFIQRGPLQSSNSPSFRAWATEPAEAAATAAEHHHRMHQGLGLNPSVPAFGFASGAGFSGFRIPARIQGEEEHDGDKPPSASSVSHH